MTEPIDVKKVVDVSPTTLVKTSSSTFKGLMVILGVVAILFCVYFTVKSLFNKPKPTQPITVQSGGLVNVINEANKRHLILFAEPYVFAEGGNTSRTGLGVKVGARWEF
jgi:hypothetical protein